MRPKVVITILLVASGVLGIAVWISQVSRPQPTPSQTKSTTGDSPEAPEVSTGHVAGLTAVASVAPSTGITNSETTNVVVVQGVEHTAYVRMRAAELDELAMQKSSTAHQTIVLELKNPDRAIRQAALDALKQADDRSVVPQMQQIADQTDDSDERKAILDAIDYINLPSLTEYLQQQKVQGAAGNPSAPGTNAR